MCRQFSAKILSSAASRLWLICSRKCLTWATYPTVLSAFRWIRAHPPTLADWPWSNPAIFTKMIFTQRSHRMLLGASSFWQPSREMQTQISSLPHTKNRVRRPRTSQWQVSQVYRDAVSPPPLHDVLHPYFPSVDDPRIISIKPQSSLLFSPSTMPRSFFSLDFSCQPWMISSRGKQKSLLMTWYSRWMEKFQSSQAIAIFFFSRCESWVLEAIAKCAPKNLTCWVFCCCFRLRREAGLSIRGVFLKLYFSFSLDLLGEMVD